ncbi:SEFIR domain-containing protein [Aerococcus urinaeequi]|uniref:SEFIR domain-containing protein n=2 Tax=Aerococcus viridans TaxID=1377 RepID=A0AAU8UJ83_9LACT|nr:SEFIR domain-containing protein [Aerococcus viridans]AMC00201.1 hypothetical protein AWM76_00760 [Aerococcus viridans]EFG50569.1 SEFIR domain protein [Aerococcus viridans ATCC 11563 = CCUG 4311]SUU10311.1 SEFIR domain [Aerococcus viridans]
MVQEVDYVPKVFISYAWTSEEYTENVVSLAERLVHDGIDVVLDKWDLKEGQDKYKFMEQSVQNSEIKKVLILCNSVYRERADNRTGGVGDETLIITPEIYSSSNQTKFIPVIFDNTDNKSVIPTYLNSRIYIDLSNMNNQRDYEKNYEKLVRNIWNKPEFEKPKLGAMPKWLDSNEKNQSLLQTYVRNYQNESSLSKKKIFENDIFEEFIERIREHDLELPIKGDTILEKISLFLPYRNLMLDFLEIKIIEDESNLGDWLVHFAEKLYNRLKGESTSWRIYSIDEPKHFLIWELFICIIALLNEHHKYEALFTMTTASYYLKVGNTIDAKTFTYLRPYFEELDRLSADKSSEYYRKISVPGAILNSREKIPSLTSFQIAEADEMLTQLSVLFNQSGDHSHWFSYCYVYSKGTPIWKRLVSRSFCDLLMFYMECSTYEELKESISTREMDKDFNLRESFKSVRNPIQYTPIDMIATRR